MEWELTPLCVVGQGFNFLLNWLAIYKKEDCALYIDLQILQPPTFGIMVGIGIRVLDCQEYGILFDRFVLEMRRDHIQIEEEVELIWVFNFSRGH